LNQAQLRIDEIMKINIKDLKENKALKDKLIEKYNSKNPENPITSEDEVKITINDSNTNNTEIDQLILKKDLSNLDFSDEDFEDKDLRNCNLSNSNFTDAKFRSVNLKNADLSNSILTDADLSYSNLKNVNLTDAVLIGADCFKTNFSGANLCNVNFSDADLSGSIFRNAILENVTFSDTEFNSETNFKDATIKNTKIPDAVYNLSKFNPEDVKKFKKEKLAKIGPTLSNRQLDEIVNMSTEELEKANADSETLNEYYKKSKPLYDQENFEGLLELSNYYFKKIPDKIQISHDKAFALIMLRRYDEALIEYHKMIERTPENYAGYEGAGSAYFMRSEHKRAIPYLQKALELGAPPSETQTSIDHSISEVGSNVENIEVLIKQFNQRSSLPSNQHNRSSLPSSNVTIVDDNISRAMRVGATTTAGYGFKQLIENASVFHAIMLGQLDMQEKSTLDDFRKLKWSGPVFEERYDEKKLIHELERFTEEKYIEITKTGRWGKKKTVAYKITSIGRDLGYEITKKVQFRLKDKIREYHLSLSPESRQQLHRKLIENGTPCSACPPSSGVNSSGALPMDV